MSRHFSLDQQYDLLISSLESLVIQLQKHHRIKMVSWIKKLDMPINNNTWKYNRNLHAKVMIKMIQSNRLFHPFDKNPPEGPLARLNVTDLPYPIKDYFLQRSKSKNKNWENNKSPLKNESMTSLCRKQNVKPNFISFNETQDTKKPSMLQSTSHRSSWNKQSQSKQLEINHKLSEEKFIKNQQEIKPMIIDHTEIKSNLQQCLKISQELQDNKIYLILRKTLKFLVKNNDLLSDQQEYKQLVENIVAIGEEKNVNLRDVSREMSPSQSVMVFRRHDNMRKNSCDVRNSEESKKFKEYLDLCKPRFM